MVEDFSCTGPGGRIPLRLYDTRAERGPSPLLVFIHGGGYVIGSVPSYDRTCSEIAAEMDLPVVSIEYRLAPENPSLPRPRIASRLRAGWRKAPPRSVSTSPA